METKVNGIRTPKESQGTKCKGKARYTKIIEYFTEYLNTKKYNGLFTASENGKHRIQTEKFNEIFYNNSFNFLDVLYLFISCASSQQVGVLSFLLSNETNYGAKKKFHINNINFDNLNKDLTKYKDIEKRRLFTLAILSLIQDYFNTYKIDKETETIQEKTNLSDNEILLRSMFESIFNNEDLLNIFKKIKTAHINSRTDKQTRINLYEYLENIFTKTTEIHDQINGVKQQILNYFNFYYNSKEQNKNWIKDFLNTYETEIVSQQIESEQQMNSFLQQGLGIERLERERLSCFKPTRMKYEIIDNFGKQIQNSVNFESRQSINYQINFNTTYNIRCNQYNQNTFMTTFQQNQQTLQNLDVAVEMFGNEQGFGQVF